MLKDEEDWLWEDEELCEEDYEFQVSEIYFLNWRKKNARLDIHKYPSFVWLQVSFLTLAIILNTSLLCSGSILPQMIWKKYLIKR